MEGKPGRFLQGKDHRRWLLGTREVVVSSVCGCVCVCVRVCGWTSNLLSHREETGWGCWCCLSSYKCWVCLPLLIYVAGHRYTYVCGVYICSMCAYWENLPSLAPSCIWGREMGQLCLCWLLDSTLPITANCLWIIKYSVAWQLKLKLKKKWQLNFRI